LVLALGNKATLASPGWHCRYASASHQWGRPAVAHALTNNNKHQDQGIRYIFFIIFSIFYYHISVLSIFQHPWVLNHLDFLEMIWDSGSPHLLTQLWHPIDTISHLLDTNLLISSHLASKSISQTPDQCPDFLAILPWSDGNTKIFDLLVLQCKLGKTTLEVLAKCILLWSWPLHSWSDPGYPSTHTQLHPSNFQRHVLSSSCPASPLLFLLCWVNMSVQLPPTTSSWIPDLLVFLLNHLNFLEMNFLAMNLLEMSWNSGSPQLATSCFPPSWHVESCHTWLNQNSQILVRSHLMWSPTLLQSVLVRSPKDLWQTPDQCT